MINASFTFWYATYLRNNTKKTSDKSRLWWNNYKESDREFLRGEDTKQKTFHEYFLSDRHQSFEEDVSICLIDKTDTSDPQKQSITQWRI